MEISGFTVVKNAIKYNYPVIEAIKSILPICDEFIVNIGKSEDDTLGLVRSIGDKKIRIIETEWDNVKGPYVLAEQTNIALKECKGDWAFYLQADELVHEKDLMFFRRIMKKYLNNFNVDAFCFQWMHFYGSYFRYRIDRGWFQKQNRIIRNNGIFESYGDAFAFRRCDGIPIKSKKIYKMLYHYGWVHSGEMMTQRRSNHESMGFNLADNQTLDSAYDFGNLNRFPIYFGTHPKVMGKRIEDHPLTEQEREYINRKYWWYPPQIFKIRYKTGRRIKHKIDWY